MESEQRVHSDSIMNEELKSKLEADLKKSGFASEMEAIKVFLGKDWGCRGGYHYFDEDEKKNRETDLVAWRVTTVKRPGDQYLVIACHIVAEVKKTERPWIVFKRDHTHLFDALDAWNNLTHTVNLPCEPFHLSPVLSAHGLLEMLGWKAYGIHESFKKPDTPSRWYPAFVSVCKAAEHELKVQSKSDLKIETWHKFDLIKPILILDGPLIAASLTESGELQLEETDFAPFEFAYKSQAATKDSYRIDVVRLNALGKYVELTDKRMDAIMQIVSPFMGPP